MNKSFDEILDECVDRINRGERIEDCLGSYPEHSEELQLLLSAMLDTQRAYQFTPSPEAKWAARQRFNAAREQLERRWESKPPLFPRILGRPVAWAAVTAVLLISLVSYFGIIPMLSPGEPGLQPSATGNFAFLISDEVNAIGDFESLSISISSIGLHHLSGESGQWIKLDPAVQAVDLALLQGDRAQEIWRGDVPEGQYTKVFIQVSSVSGILKETGESVDVKLPSEKLHISKGFEVTSSLMTNFVYDLTVIAAGSTQSGIKYILKPQAGQSGADQRFELIEGKGADGRGQDRGPKPPRVTPSALSFGIHIPDATKIQKSGVVSSAMAYQVSLVF
jgi:hypothetical protein